MSPSDDPAAPSDDPAEPADDPAEPPNDPAVLTEDPAEPGADPVRRQAAVRRRLAEVFGDVLPDATRDENDPAEESRQGRDRDEDLLREVPPHHLP